MSESGRNPIVLPTPERHSLACPKCHESDYIGRNVQGMILFRCKKCGCRWEAGLPQLPMDPTIPRPPEVIDNQITYVSSKHDQSGIEEIRKRPDLRPDFRKGAPIPDGEEDA